MTATCVIALLATQASGAAGAPTPSADSRAQVRLDRVSAPVKCKSARNAVAYYRSQVWARQSTRGGELADRTPIARGKSCRWARYAAGVWVARARTALKALRAWEYDWAWWKWLPSKWARIGACETGYGKQPGQWTWNSGTYQGAFGFYHGSWDAFVGSADRKAGPYPSEAYNATPRQQYEVALAIWRRYGFSGWGCASA